MPVVRMQHLLYKSRWLHFGYRDCHLGSRRCDEIKNRFVARFPQRTQTLRRLLTRVYRSILYRHPGARLKGNTGRRGPVRQSLPQ